jgi:hypothetical protein
MIPMLLELSPSRLHPVTADRIIGSVIGSKSMQVVPLEMHLLEEQRSEVLSFL